MSPALRAGGKVAARGCATVAHRAPDAAHIRENKVRSKAALKTAGFWLHFAQFLQQTKCYP
jgi:hypothetical protein